MSDEKIMIESDPIEGQAIVTKMRKGIYLLPNLFTTAALFAGFYAIVASMKNMFGVAAMVTFVAMVLDSLDGRVARLTHTTSAFGAEYDSLSDMVAFGLSPALMMYTWGLHTFGKIGWLIAFCYAAATALRLARFNVQHATMDRRYFRGIPCTAAAGVIAGFIWVQDIYQIPSYGLYLFGAALTLIIALLMVSNIYFRSFKDSDFQNRISFFIVPLVVLLFVGIALDPPDVLAGIFFLYALSGPMGAVWRYLKRKKQKA